MSIITILAILLRICKSPNAKITKKRQYPEMFDFIIKEARLTFLIVRQAIMRVGLYPTT